MGNLSALAVPAVAHAAFIPVPLLPPNPRALRGSSRPGGCSWRAAASWRHPAPLPHPQPHPQPHQPHLGAASPPLLQQLLRLPPLPATPLWTQLRSGWRCC